MAGVPGAGPGGGGGSGAVGTGLKAYFKTPEGRYKLQYEKTHSAVPNYGHGGRTVSQVRMGRGSAGRRGGNGDRTGVRGIAASVGSGIMVSLKRHCWVIGGGSVRLASLEVNFVSPVGCSELGKTSLRHNF